jgi:hypothetical protein
MAASWDPEGAAPPRRSGVPTRLRNTSAGVQREPSSGCSSPRSGLFWDPLNVLTQNAIDVA